MNIYIVENLDGVSTSYHSGGAVAIVAGAIDHARELLDEYRNGLDFDDVDVGDEVRGWWAERDAESFATATVYELAKAGTPPMVFAFPDAGCC